MVTDALRRDSITKSEYVSFDWAASLAAEAQSATCLTIGLVSGSRLENDRRTVDKLASALCGRLEEIKPSGRVLLMRFEVDTSHKIDTSEQGKQRIPVAQKSPIGVWADVTIPISASRKPTRAQQQLPEWLPLWKDAFQLILVDLGPINLVAGRAVGRLCDGCYILLGPACCGSQEWIMQQIAWHDQFGSTICGTLVASKKQAA